MPPKAVRPRSRRRKHWKLDPDPSPDDSQKPSAASPESSPIIDADAGEGPSGTHDPMPGPSERLHEREMQYESDISTTAYNIEEKIKHLICLQSQERQKFYRGYSYKFLSLIVKWNLDTDKVIKQREKLMVCESIPRSCRQVTMHPTLDTQHLSLLEGSESQREAGDLNSAHVPMAEEAEATATISREVSGGATPSPSGVFLEPPLHPESRTTLYGDHLMRPLTTR